jgi:hypothetical protein
MTTRNDDARANCANPIEADVLLDYWLATLPPPAEEAVEEHLLTCDRCGDQLREMRVVVSDGFVQHAKEWGGRVREYAPPRGGSVPCTVAAEDDLLVARLAADLSGSTRVDLSFCDAEGIERQRLTDIPVRAEAGGVIYQESITFAKASPSNTMIARLVAVDAEGVERLIGEYTFHHTRTIPPV